MKEQAMDCSKFDWKAYVLEEVSAAQAGEYARHAESCGRCREEVAALTATTAALRAMPLAEVPRQIVFVSDPVLTTPWWRRLWTASPQWGFASAAVLALAIVAHGMMVSRNTPAPAPAQIAAETQQQIDQRVATLVDARVQQRTNEEVRRALTDFQKQLAEQDRLQAVKLDQRIDAQRESDRKAVSFAYERLERRLNYVMLSARNGGGN
jgi:anti-sigma factor RsiW